MALAKPLASGTKGSLTVSVKERQGNESKIVRRFAVRWTRRLFFDHDGLRRCRAVAVEVDGHH
jgi:hypothetical protein